MEFIKFHCNLFIYFLIKINIINNIIDYINTKNKSSPRSQINNNTNIISQMKQIQIKVKYTCSKAG